MRVAILGGGVGAMTAAYWLTNPRPDGTIPQHDVTVYQLGWRLGGKGASGRNAAVANRIEEHGMHVWMGFYANAFRMMRAVYKELNRPPGSPLATWDEAFKPQDMAGVMERGANGRWVSPEWLSFFPPYPCQPGDQTGFPPPCGYVPTILHRIKEIIEERMGCVHPAHTEYLKTLRASLEGAAARAGQPHEPGRPCGEPSPQGQLLLRLMLEGAQKLIGVGFDLVDDCVEVDRALTVADLGVATALGILRDLCGSSRWDVIDDQEWRAWMLANGLHARTAWSSVVRGQYDGAFAYAGGITDEAHATLAAGTYVQAMMRVFLDYYGAVIYKMQAGMGDTVFGPLYRVLERRGVQFRFFHRLREVVPAAGGKSIDELRIGIQARTIEDQPYRPLVDVKGLECWPSEPLYEQLRDADELRKIDLESYATASHDLEELRLKRGSDFDLVVFGLSLGAVPHVCPQILEQKEQWRAMVEHIPVVSTQSLQLWLSRDLAGLGWPPALDDRCRGERPILTAFDEPMAAWADMSQLIPREEWSVPVQNIAYFGGVMAGDADPESVADNARRLLDRDLGALWTSAVTPEGKFHYDWLCVNDPNGQFTDDERFRGQYFRANTEPTETYVQSPAGSTKYRIDPADPGYDNLCLAGDWVANGFATGCVEGAVLGGMKGVRRYCPGMVIVE